MLLFLPAQLTTTLLPPLLRKIHKGRTFFFILHTNDFRETVQTRVPAPEIKPERFNS